MKRSPRMYSGLRFSWIPIFAANTEVRVTCGAKVRKKHLKMCVGKKKIVDNFPATAGRRTCEIVLQ